MNKIGFIGLGRMGRPMAGNLQKKGFSLVVNDIDPAPVDVLRELGAEAGTVAEIAAACDVVITVLPASVEVEEIVLGPGGVLENGREGQIVMDMSTVEPQTTDRLVERLAEKGMRVVDAPIGRLASHADAGESLFMVGASDDDFATVTPLLDAMGTTTHHCGAPGTGIRTKLVNNYLAIISCQLNAEALALSQAFGLDLTKSLDVIFGTSATNGQLRLNWLNKVLQGDTEPGFTIDLAHKDLGLILAAAQAEQVPLPVAAAAREMFSTARATGYGKQDFSAVIDSLCDLAGIDKARLPGNWNPLD